MSPASLSSDSRAVRGRILAIDYGRRRIGLALSDELHLTAQPLATLQRTNRRDDLRRLREFVRLHGVRQIIVGHPLHLDGARGEMAAEAARFATRLKKHLGLPVELVDERLTTWEAEQIFSPARAAAGSAGGRRSAGTRRGSSSGRSRTASADHLAAAVLLRDYLESLRLRAAGQK